MSPEARVAALSGCVSCIADPRWHISPLRTTAVPVELFPSSHGTSCGFFWRQPTRICFVLSEPVDTARLGAWPGSSIWMATPLKRPHMQDGVFPRKSLKVLRQHIFRSLQPSHFKPDPANTEPCSLASWRFAQVRIRRNDPDIAARE